MSRRRSSVVVLAAAGALATAWWAGCRATGQPGGGPGAAASTTSQPASGPTSAPATTSAPAVRAVHVFVSGRVQGVGFRAFTQRNAQALQLVGWVRNLRDGRVEAVIEGPPDKVAELLEKVRKGPDPANVTDVAVTDQAPTGEFKDFQVRN